MASVQDQDVLRNMILTFRVTDLQMLLGFAGRNKNGKKHELQARALALVKIRSTPMQAKIRELYKASQESQAAAAMMGGGGQPINPYPGTNYGVIPGYNAPQAGGVQRMPFASGIVNNNFATYNRRPGTQGLPTFRQQVPTRPGRANNTYQNFQAIRPSAATSVSMHPLVKFIELPFYDVKSELLKPTSLNPLGANRFHERQFQFQLNQSQATDIASTRDIQVGTRMDYPFQIQLRFCPLSLEPNKEMSDEFPPSVNVHVNGKMVQLPNPIPTNKPGVEPKRPPKPVNITPHCKLSPILPNTVGVKWAAEYGKGWVVAIFLVVKLTSEDLLDRLKKKGTREPDYTRNLIIQKLNNDDDDVATTSLKVSVTCPLGKMRMKVPCRPKTCNHLQCFDAALFLQMNERKPTWNCPVCSQKALYSDLLIDGYYQEILDSKETIDSENVVLEKDGTWRPVKKNEDDIKDSLKFSNGRTFQNQSPDLVNEPHIDEVIASHVPNQVISSNNVNCIDIDISLSDDNRYPLPLVEDCTDYVQYEDELGLSTSSNPPLPPNLPLPPDNPPLPQESPIPTLPPQPAEIVYIDID